MNSKVTYSTLVKTKSNDFSQTDVLISRFINKEPLRFVEMSSAKLAETIGVGQASIIRYCRKIGFTGLSDLKITLRSELEDAEPETFTEVTSISEQADSFVAIAQQLAGNIQSALNETLLLQTEESLAEVAHCLNQAENIYFYGIGMSAVTAQHAKFRFMRIRSRLDALTDNHQMLMNSNNATKGDLVVAISHTGSTDDIIKAVKRARRNGARILVISKFQTSPLSEFADLILLTGGPSNPYASDSSTITTVQCYVLDLLFNSMVYINKGQSVKKMIEALKSISDD